MKSNTRQVIRQLEQYKRDIQKNTEKTVKELAQIGGRQAKMYLMGAEYTGSRNADIEIKSNGNKGEVAMVGEGAGFIEFGTGVTYWTGADSHPLEGQIPNTLRGEYGEKHGRDGSWIYKGDRGTARSTWELKDKSGKPTGMSITRGHRANRVIYDTGKDLEEIAITVAKEVFDK